MPTCSMASGVQVWVEGVGSCAIQGAGWESNPIDFTASKASSKVPVLSYRPVLPTRLDSNNVDAMSGRQAVGSFTLAGSSWLSYGPAKGSTADLGLHCPARRQT